MDSLNGFLFIQNLSQANEYQTKGLFLHVNRGIYMNDIGNFVSSIWGQKLPQEPISRVSQLSVSKLQMGILLYTELIIHLHL